jgi:hypothetical protein
MRYEIQHQNIYNNREKSECQPNQRKGNDFHNRLYEKVDKSHHRSGQNKPFPITMKMNAMHETRGRPNADGIGKDVNDEA